jgi:ubiquinone/menaquinone biosynthesis C-methylase UbiE
LSLLILQLQRANSRESPEGTIASISKLKMFSAKDYVGVTAHDPIRFYRWPIIGWMYRRRVELCLAECEGGERVLEVGFGSGVTFMNLHERYEEIYGLDLNAKVDAVKALFEKKGVKTFLQNGNVMDMPYPDCFFDTILLISILEHLKPNEQTKAFHEISRVLRPKGQVVYGVPIERPMMTFMFRLLGYNIRKYHHSTEKEVEAVARKFLGKKRIANLGTPFGVVYQIGSFYKN